MHDRYTTPGLAFEPNVGQTDSQVQYVAHGHGYTVFLTGSDMVLALQKPHLPLPLHTLVEQIDAGTVALTPTEQTVVRLHFVGANAVAAPRAQDPLTSTASYFIGATPQSWHTGVARYGRIVYHNLYPGIDLAYHGAHDLEYDWLLAPGADPSLIQFTIQGPQGLALDAQGNLLVQTAVGVMRQTVPTAYQDVNGQRHSVSVRYTLDGAGQVGVALGAYDASKPLVIDPTLSYSTYLGGSGTDVGTGITTDSAGDAYVVGWTGSTNFPVTGGVYGTILNGPTDVFIAKFNPTGSLMWSTYLGGSGDDVQYDAQIAGIAVDGSGNVYVSGSTVSTNFPTTSNAVQTVFGGGNDAFVSEISATGQALLYSTYLGGSCNEYAPALAVDSSGKIYVTGGTCSGDFPTLHSLQAFDGGSDAFVVKIDPTASSSLIYSTFLGGYGQDGAYGIAVDTAGDAYVTGDTNAPDFPTTPNAFQRTRASYCADGTCHDAFFSEINAAGTSLLYSTYFGGTHDERAMRLALDASNNVYITGWTSSTTAFTTTVGAYQTGPQGGVDAFVVKFNPAASGLASLVYGARLGGSGDDYGYGIAVDSTGDVLVTGSTASPNFPTTNDALQGGYGGSVDAYIVRLNPAGSAPLYSTYLGGSGDDEGDGIATDASGNAYVTGRTASTTFATKGAVQGANGGGTDAFVTKMAFVSSGTIPWHPHYSAHLSAGLDVRVDLADGHTDVTAADLSIPARGPNLTLSHTWDSTLATIGSAYSSNGWVNSLTLSMGGVLTQTIALTDATGAVWQFPYKGSPTDSAPYTTYQIPAGQPWSVATSPITGYTLSNLLTGEVLTFNAQGRYLAATDAYSNSNTMGYDASGLTSVTNSGGRSLALGYYNGLMTNAQSPLWRSSGGSQGQDTTYGYTNNYLSALARGSGTSDATTEYFGYGVQPAGAALGFMTAIQTPRATQWNQGAGGAWTLAYDAQGRVISISSPISGTMGQTGYTPSYTTTISYSPGQTIVIEGAGSTAPITHIYTLDAQGEATKTQDALGDAATTTYDTNHDPLTVTDANGNTTTNLYQYVGPTGSFGLRTTTVLPAIGLYLPGNTAMTSTITNRYDPTMFDLLESDKPEGGVALYTYDGHHGVVTSTVLASDNGNTFCPNAVVRAPGAITPQLGGTCSYTQQWRSSVTHYDAYGERISTVDGRGFTPASLTTTSANGSPIPPTPQLDPVQAPLYTRTSRYTILGDLQSSSTPPLTTTLNITGTAPLTTTGPVTTSYGYDGDGNQTGLTSANGYATTMTFDHLGRQTSSILPRVTLYDGSSSTPTNSTTYDGDGNVVQTRNANGKTTTSSYDPWQRLSATTDPVSGTTLYTYTATEQVAVQDPQGNVTTSQYDPAGRLSLTTDPSHNTTQYQYDPVGNTVAITGGTAGAATTIETRSYDARNEVSTDTTSGPGLATPLTTQTFYDGDGAVAQVQQPNGDTIYNLYDLSDLLLSTEINPAPVSKTSAKGAPTYDFYTYDAAGNQTTHADGDNRIDTLTLDGDNRTVQDVARGPGSGGTTITTTNRFDPDGTTVFWTRQTQPPTGPVQTQTDSVTFDAADRQVATTDNGLTTRYGYDAAGRQRTHTIVDGTTGVATTLDSEGRAVALSESMGGSGPYTGRWGYNLNDLPVTLTVPGGVQGALGYDPSSRLVTTTLSGPAVITLGNTHTGASQDTDDANCMVGSSITSGTQGGQITAVSAYVGALDPNRANDLYQVALYSDSSGTPGTLIASSASATLTANAWNSVALAATLAPRTTYWLMYNTNGSAASYNNLAYDAGGAGAYSVANQPFGSWPSAFGASSPIAYGYALYATLSSGTPTPALTLHSTYAYGYNAVNWTTSTTTLSGTDTLVHDAQGRLTGETGPQVVATGGAYAWTYDKNGNLTSQIGDDGYPVTYTYTQPITPNEVQTMVMGDGQPTAYYGYDAHGDTTAITDGARLNTHVVYDSQARPVQITTLNYRTPVTVTLSYNPSGLRAEYTIAESGKTTLDEKFTYRAGLLGQMQLVQGSLAYTDTYLYTEAGAPYELLRQQNGATSRYWYEVDGRGNVVALTDLNGKVVDRYAYDSWGELTSDDGVNESVPQQLRYAGYWYDEKLSWYWLSVRYYDPEIARFLAPDPSEQDGVRTYAYVNNDPVDATDPSGLCQITLHFQPAFPIPIPTPYGTINWPTPIGKHAFITVQDNNDPYTYFLFEGTKHSVKGKDYILAGADGGPADPLPQVFRRAPSHQFSDNRLYLQPSLNVLNDKRSCGCYLNKLILNAQSIDHLGLTYETPAPGSAGNPFYPINSNAFAYTVLTHNTGIHVSGTLYQDVNDRVHQYNTYSFLFGHLDDSILSVPGWGRDLLNSHWSP